MRSARLLRPLTCVGRRRFDRSADPFTPRSPADRMRDALVRLSEALGDAHRPGALLLYDEAHLLADDRSRERYPLSSLLAALGAVQRSGEPRVRIVLTGLPTLSDQPQARPNICRADVPPRRAREPRARRRLGRTHDPARREPRDDFATSVVGEIVEATGGYPVFPAVLRRLSVASVPAPEVTSAVYRASNLACSTNWTLAFFDDRFQGATPPSRLCSSRWRGKPAPSTSRRFAAPSRDGRRCRTRQPPRRTRPSVSHGRAPTTSPCRCSAPISAGKRK